MMQLYNYYRSSASFRVRIVLNLKNIDYQDVPIHLVNNGGEQFSAEFTQLNPQNLVPVLKENDKIISQSLSIIEYLDEIYPTPPLLPSDSYEKALVRSLALSIGADIHPLNNTRVLKYLTQVFKVSEEQKTTWYHHWIHLGFNALEKRLKSFPSKGNFCYHNTPTLADVFLVPQLYNARRFNCDLTDYPLLCQIDAHCREHPAFIKAWPNEENV